MDSEESGEDAGIFKITHAAIISGVSTLSAFASSFTLNLATLKFIVIDDLIKI